MKYEFLNDEVKGQIREQTLAQIERDHYAFLLARQRQEAIDNVVGVEQADAQLESLEKQHKAVKSGE